MTYALLFEIAWKSLVTSGAALLLLAALKNRTAAERSWIGHAGLLATLVLPAAILFLPNWQVDAPAPLAGAIAEPSLLSGAGLSPGPAAVAAAARSSPIDLWALSLWLYAVPAALLLLAMLVAVLRLFAIRRRASVMVEQVWLSALAHAQRRMGFKHGTALLVSNELASPVSWGLLRPIILLNDETIASASDAEAIIAHELAHVARLDWAKLLTARAATALFWFNPFVWILARQCHQLREEAVDDAVLRADVRETDYAALLVAAARHETRGVLLAAHGVAPGRDSLKRRVTRILDTGLSRAPARAAWITACSTGAVLISAPLAALTPVAPIPATAATVARLDRPLVLAAPVTLPQPAADRARATASAAVDRAAFDEPPAVEPAPLLAAAQEEDERVRPERTARTEGQARSRRGLPSPEDLVAMRVQGVTPEFAAAFASIDGRYSDLSPDDLVAFRIHGVSPELVRQLVSLGYRGLTPEELTAMAIHGVTPSFVRDLAEAGYRGLSADTLTAMRIHGVTPDYVRAFRNAGYRDVSARELIDMRIHGVSPPGGRDP